MSYTRFSSISSLFDKESLTSYPESSDIFSSVDLSLFEEVLQASFSHEEYEEEKPDPIRERHDMVEYEKDSDRSLKDHKYNNAIIGFLAKGQLDKAIQYLEESLAQYNTYLSHSDPTEKREIIAGIVNVYFDLAIIYKNKGKLNRAIGYASEGMLLNNILLSDNPDQSAIQRNTKGVEIVKACENELIVSHPIPVTKIRAASDKKNVVYTNSL